MLIGLNMLPVLQENGGTWNYVANLIQGLASWDKENTYYAFVNSESKELVPIQGNFKVCLARINARSRPLRVFYEHLWLISQANKLNLDCIHWLGNTIAITNRIPSLVTIYDILPFSQLTSASILKRTYLKLMIQHASRIATIILPMSNATSQALQQQVGVSSANITVIPMPLLPTSKRADMDAIARLREHYGLPDMFWLYVAHTYPHKNHVRLLEAYAKLRRSGQSLWPLVLRGDPRKAEYEISEAIQKLGVEDFVIRLPRLEEWEMSILYSAASALIFPSQYEGGGLPVVEAMACGCPVVASNLDSIMEYCGDAALYFNPNELMSIYYAMVKIQSEPGLRQQLTLRGAKQTLKFHQKEIVSRLIAEYAKAAQASSKKSLS